MRVIKVFISYSRKDRWVARMIKEQIESRSGLVFLDEKDIKTGDDIDQRIQDGLRRCDHLLVLLSPSSIRSEWVLMELGGAKVLGKRIVPILLCVEEADIPKLIHRNLARSINDIESYFAELEDVVIPAKRPERTSLRVGDRVRVIGVDRRRGVPETQLDLHWAPDMDKYLGTVAEIEKISQEGVIDLDVDSGRYGWATEWLQRDPP